MTEAPPEFHPDPFLQPIIGPLERSGEPRDLALVAVLKSSSINNQFLRWQNEKLASIEEQTTLTNGRVTTLDKNPLVIIGRFTQQFWYLAAPAAVIAFGAFCKVLFEHVWPWFTHLFR